MSAGLGYVGENEEYPEHGCFGHGRRPDPEGHMSFLGGNVWCPKTEQKHLIVGHRYRHAYTCPGCGAEVPAE